MENKMKNIIKNWGLGHYDVDINIIYLITMILIMAFVLLKIILAY